jgi:hypothetical protein
LSNETDKRVYLLKSDYEFIVQEETVAQVIGTKERLRKYAEEVALAEIDGYLITRFDTAREFRETVPYLSSDAYKALSRVILDYDPWLITQEYVIGDEVIGSDGIAYVATADSGPLTAVQDPATTTGFWDILGDQYDMFVANSPEEEWDYKKLYTIGSKIFKGSYVYTALFESRNKDPETETYFWQADALPFEVPAGTLVDPVYWTKKDDRDKKIVWCAAIITLINLYKRVSPKNIPIWIEEAYRGKMERDYVGKAEIYKNPSTVIGWLSMLSEGDRHTSMRSLPEHEGNRIRMIAKDKRENAY